MKSSALSVGGIEARLPVDYALSRLANGLIDDAGTADKETRNISRHVNTQELIELCRLVLTRLGVQREAEKHIEGALTAARGPQAPPEDPPREA
jgi:hypothetical protein